MNKRLVLDGIETRMNVTTDETDAIGVSCTLCGWEFEAPGPGPSLAAMLRFHYQECRFPKSLIESYPAVGGP